jgi:hypothetical protein
MAPLIRVLFGNSLSIPLVSAGLLWASLWVFGIVSGSEDVQDNSFFTELGKLRNEVPGSISLAVSKCEIKKTLFNFYNTQESAKCALVTFDNTGKPRRVAKSVAAKITYLDADARSFTLDGRWADTDFPSADPTKSNRHLLRVDFGVGEDRVLDIAAQFGLECFAVNDASLTNNVKDPNLRLIGPTIRVTVRLLAEQVDQTFTFELKTDIRKLQIARL